MHPRNTDQSPCWVAIAPLTDSTERLEAHRIYWTVSENDPITAPIYNVGKGSQALYRGSQSQKQMAVSVRCVRE